MPAQAPGGFDTLLARGVEFQHHRDGLGVVFLDAQNFVTYQQHTAKMRGLGYDGTVSVYQGSEVQDFDPAISRNAAGVVHLEDERHVHPESLSAGLARAVTEHGGSLLENTPVIRIEPDRSGRWGVVSSNQQRWTFDQLVVSAGFQTRKLLLPLKIRLPLEAAKGVSITACGDGVLPTHPLKLFEHMVASSPFDGGLLRLSGTFDVGQRSDIVNEERLNMVVRDASQFFESWTPTTIESTGAGHRPTSADDTPLIGPVPGHDGLYMATGHGTLGVTLGPITGALVSREISARRSEPLLAPFRPERFNLRF